MEPTDRTQWANRPLAERQEYQSQLHIPHPSFVTAYREILRMSERCRMEKRGHALMVLAESGNGKTHLATVVTQLHPRDDSGEISRVPVVSLGVPAQPTYKALGSALILSFNVPRVIRGTAQEILEQGVSFLHTAQTRIVFIDNIQDIPERRKAAGVMQLGNWLRELIDRSKCLIVLLGTHAATAMTDNNAQLRRRVSRRIAMERMNPSHSKENASKYYRFLYEIDIRLPLAEHSDLAEHDRAKRIFYATFGILDFIFQLLSEAVYSAVTAQRERIIDEDLATAFRRLFQNSRDDINPFVSKLAERVLDREDEPFHNWYDPSNPNPYAAPPR